MKPDPRHRAAAATTAHRRTRALTLALIALVLVVAFRTTSAAATTASVDPAGGFAPRWAIGVDGATDPDPRAYGFAVDRVGGVYVSSGATIVRQYSAAGHPVRTVEATGTGWLETRGLVVSDDLEVTVVGHVSGSFTVGSPPHQVTLEDDGTSLFLIHLDATGTVEWATTYDGLTNVYGLHQVGHHVVARGQYSGPLAFDGLQLPGDGGVDVFLASFSDAGGEVEWLTGLEGAGPDAEDIDLFPTSGSIDADRFALAGGSFGDFEVMAAGTTTPVNCDNAPGGGCWFLLTLDPESGTVDLARALELPAGSDDVNVALTASGYAIVGDTFSNLAGTGSRISTLSADGDIVQSFAITGSTTATDLAVDANGDLVASLTMSGPTTLGSGAGPPTLAPVGRRDLLVVELDETLALSRWLTAGGAGATVPARDNTVPSVRIGPGDQVLVTGDHDGTVTFGSDARAVTVAGDGTFLASFPPDRPADAGSTFHPSTPTRLLDSRTSTGGWNGKLVAGSPRELTVAGVAGVPADATAVVLNLTATDTSAMTYLAAWPTGIPQPTASTLNLDAGGTIANHATVAVGANETITLATAQGTTNVVADLYGYYTPDATGAGFHAIDPTRLLDSRTTTGGWNHTLDAGSPRNLAVTGGTIPADATGVVMSVTATDTSDLTYLRIEPTGTTTGSSNLNVQPGQTITNLVTTPIGTNGQVTFTNNTGRVNVIADAVGYYRQDATGARFHAIDPIRALDSRTGNGGFATPWGPDTTRAIDLDGLLPTNTITSAIAANLTATDTTAMSYLTLYPMAPRPATSNLLFTAGQTIAAAATTGVASDGTVSLFNQLGSANLVLDLDGYFTAP